VCAATSGHGHGARSGLDLPVQSDRLQPEGVIPFRNHHERDGSSIRFCMQMPGFQPCAQPRIEDLRLTLPEIRFQATLNLEMVQLQFDARNLLGKIAPDIVDAHMKSGDAATLALCLDHHRYLPINAG